MTEDRDIFAELRISIWEKAQAESAGPRWGSDLLAVEVGFLALACSSGASLALVEMAAVPEYVAEEISDAVDLLEVDATPLDVEDFGARTIRVGTDLTWSLVEVE